MPRPGGGFGNPETLGERQSKIRSRPSLAAQKTEHGVVAMSSIVKATWADLDFGRIEHQDISVVQGIREALGRIGLYEFQEDSSGLWAKLKDSVRDRGVFTYSGQLTSQNLADNRIFSDLERYWWDLEKRRPQLFSYDRTSYRKRIESARGYKQLTWIKSLLFRVSYEDFPGMLREVVAPAFFRSYPKGSIHLVRIDQNLVKILQALDITGISGVYSIPEIASSRRRSLTAGQGSGLEQLGGNILNAVLSSFYPNLYGIVVDRMSFLLLFQWCPSLKLTDKWKAPSLVEVLRSKRMLEKRLSLEDFTSSTSEKDLSRKAGPPRFTHVTRWRSQDVTDLVTWSVQRINQLYLALIDPVSFRNDDGSVDLIKQRQYYLTIDRIISETITVNTEEDTFTRKQIFFDVLDKYATLSAPKIDLKDRERTYLRLLKRTHFERRLEPLLDSLPERQRLYIVTMAKQIYDQSVDQAIKGIWSKGRIDSRRRLVQLKSWDKASSQFVDRPPKISFEDFTAEVIHAIRNSLHGYRMMNRTYECLLAMHSCEVSNTLPDLSTVFLFLLLSDPGAFAQHRWSQDSSRA